MVTRTTTVLFCDMKDHGSEKISIAWRRHCTHDADHDKLYIRLCDVCSERNGKAHAALRQSVSEDLNRNRAGLIACKGQHSLSEFGRPST